MSAAVSWTCPSCERRVPPRVAVCRCGTRRDAPAPSGHAPATPPPAGAAPKPTTAAGTALLVLLLIGGAWWSTRPAAVPREAAGQAAAPGPVGSIDRPEPPQPTMPATPSAAPASTTPVAPGSTTPVPAATAAAGSAVAAPATSGALEDVVARAIGGVVMVEATGSRGTGFFVAPDLVVTNEHVVGRDSTVTIRLHDGAIRMARVERTRADVDLALLRTAAVPATPVLVLGRADTARVGQEVIAIGSALGLQSTVTRGILSAKRQSGPVLLLQTDAAINPGNSGGPLLDRDGAVLGVTTLKVSGAAEGLGFAVSADHVRGLIEGRPPLPAAAGAAAAPSAGTGLPSVGRDLDTSAEGQRAAGTAAFERDLQALAQHAAQIDAQWARFASTCQPAAAADGDRPWFALASHQTRFTGPDRNCPYWLTDLETASRAFGEAMRSIGEQARRAGVYPGDQRSLRRQYRVDWSGFDR